MSGLSNSTPTILPKNITSGQDIRNYYRDNKLDPEACKRAAVEDIKNKLDQLELSEEEKKIFVDVISYLTVALKFCYNEDETYFQSKKTFSQYHFGISFVGIKFYLICKIKSFFRLDNDFVEGFISSIMQICTHRHTYFSAILSYTDSAIKVLDHIKKPHGDSVLMRRAKIYLESNLIDRSILSDECVKMIDIISKYPFATDLLDDVIKKQLEIMVSKNTVETDIEWKMLEVLFFVLREKMEETCIRPDSNISEINILNNILMELILNKEVLHEVYQCFSDAMCNNYRYLSSKLCCFVSVFLVLQRKDILNNENIKKFSKIYGTTYRDLSGFKYSNSGTGYHNFTAFVKLLDTYGSTNERSQIIFDRYFRDGVKIDELHSSLESCLPVLNRRQNCTEKIWREDFTLIFQDTVYSGSISAALGVLFDISYTNFENKKLLRGVILEAYKVYKEHEELNRIYLSDFCERMVSKFITHIDRLIRLVHKARGVNDTIFQDILNMSTEQFSTQCSSIWDMHGYIPEYLYTQEVAQRIFEMLCDLKNSRNNVTADSIIRYMEQIIVPPPPQPTRHVRGGAVAPAARLLPEGIAFEIHNYAPGGVHAPYSFIEFLLRQKNDQPIPQLEREDIIARVTKNTWKQTENIEKERNILAEEANRLESSSASLSRDIKKIKNRVKKLEKDHEYASLNCQFAIATVDHILKDFSYGSTFLGMTSTILYFLAQEDMGWKEDYCKFETRFQLWIMQCLVESKTAYEGANSVSCLKGILERTVTGLRQMHPGLDAFFVSANVRNSFIGEDVFAQRFREYKGAVIRSLTFSKKEITENRIQDEYRFVFVLYYKIFVKEGVKVERLSISDKTIQSYFDEEIQEYLKRQEEFYLKKLEEKLEQIEYIDVLPLSSTALIDEIMDSCQSIRRFFDKLYIIEDKKFQEAIVEDREFQDIVIEDKEFRKAIIDAWERTLSNDFEAIVSEKTDKLEDIAEEIASLGKEKQKEIQEKKEIDADRETLKMLEERAETSQNDGNRFFFLYVKSKDRIPLTYHSHNTLRLRLEVDELLEDKEKELEQKSEKSVRRQEELAIQQKDAEIKLKIAKQLCAKWEARSASVRE